MVKSVKQVVKDIEKQTNIQALQQLNGIVVRRIQEIKKNKTVRYRNIIKRGDIVYLEFSGGIKPTIVTDTRISTFDTMYITKTSEKEYYTAKFSMIKSVVRVNVGTPNKKEFFYKIKKSFKKSFEKPHHINHFIETALIYKYGTLSLWGRINKYKMKNLDYEQRAEGSN